jgi:nucleoside-diphosphate-sugar epimerase
MIGLALTENLLRRGWSVRCFDLYEQFLRRRDEVQGLQKLGDVEIVPGTIMDRWAIALAAKECHAVVHLAALLGVRRTEENRLLCIDINVNGTDNVLNACVQNNVGRVVLASSSEVYGEPNRNPVREDDETKGKTVYAVTKLAAEELAKGYHQICSDLDYSIVRFFNTYGEGQVAQFVLSRFVKRVVEGQNPVVFGDGMQQRSFCHVADAVEGVALILESERARNRTYNIGNSREVYTLREAAQKVIDTLALGKGHTVEAVGFEDSDRTAEREIFTRFCDTTRAAEELGFQPRISLEEGIRRIAAAPAIHDSWIGSASL